MRGSKRFQLALCVTGFSAALAGCSKTVTKTGDSTPAPDQKKTLSPAVNSAAQSCPGVIDDANLAALPPTGVVHDRMNLDAKTTLNFTLTTGYLPLYAQGTQSGTIRACLFYWAYTRDDQSTNANWPVTFLFNGGPGSSSDWIQFGGNGPKKLDLGPEGITVPTSSALVDDSSTLLANSDLVFIDPINTGLSRPAKGVDASAFDGLDQDAYSIGDFINGYLTEAKRMASPKYIVGESYAGMRIPVLARYLDEKLGIKLKGFTMVSPWLDAIGDSFGDELANDLPYVTFLPEYATTAWYHKKLPAALQALTAEQVFEQVREYADTTYAEALIQGNDLPAADQASVAAQLAQYTGLTVAEITADNLRVPMSHFQTEVLKDQGLTISYYDGRMASVIKDPTTQDPTDAFDGDFLAAVAGMLKSTGLSISQDWYQDSYNFNAWPGANPSGAIEGSYLNVLDDLSTFIEKNPETGIFVAGGLYDLDCPPAEVKYMLNHISAADAAHIQVARYEGGHPVYFGDKAHALFAADLAAFYAGTPVPGATAP